MSCFFVSASNSTIMTCCSSTFTTCLTGYRNPLTRLNTHTRSINYTGLRGCVTGAGRTVNQWLAHLPHSSTVSGFKSEFGTYCVRFTNTPCACVRFLQVQMTLAYFHKNMCYFHASFTEDAKLVHLSLYLSIYLSIDIYIYIQIYIQIDRQVERQLDREIDDVQSSNTKPLMYQHIWLSACAHKQE